MQQLSQNPQHHRHLRVCAVPSPGFYSSACHTLLCLCHACACPGNTLTPFHMLSPTELSRLTPCLPLSRHLAPLALSPCSKDLRAEQAQPGEGGKGVQRILSPLAFPRPKASCCLRSWCWDTGLPAPGLYSPFTTQAVVGMLCLLGLLYTGKGLAHL